MSTLFGICSFAMIDAGAGPESAVRTTEGPGMAAYRSSENAQTGVQTAGTVSAAGRQIDPSKPMIALTYDDGPQTESGNRIIDTFMKYDQRCTFFVVGDRISSRAEEIKRMADNGFEIGNHSYSHKYLNKCDAATIRSEIDKCNSAISQVAGVTPKVMRLPGGNKNQTVLSNVNMPIILWNVDTRDWDHRNVQKTLDAVIGKVKDGDIVLMHELYSATADATEILVPKLLEQGFQLVTVSELAQAKGVSLTANQVYYSFK